MKVKTRRNSWKIWKHLDPGSWHWEGSESESHSVMSNSLWPHGLYSPRNSLGQNTGIGDLSLLQGIFPNQGTNPGLPHCMQILYQLSYQGSPKILEWVAYPVSSRSSQPKNRTRVSCIAWGFFTNWTIREASGKEVGVLNKLQFFILSYRENFYFLIMQMLHFH